MKTTSITNYRFSYRLKIASSFLGILFMLSGVSIKAQESSNSVSSKTYWVTKSGSDSNDGTSEAKAWSTLKHACRKVASDQGHTIKMGPGTFYDSGRKSTNNTPAILPRNVNLIGSGKSETTYKGEIYAPSVNKQVISDFRMDGNENRIASTSYFSGLIIDEGSNLVVRNMKIDGFHSMGLQFGKYDGLSYSSLHSNSLINNGKHNERGFGMRTGNLENCKIFNNTFIEERGKGGEVWNSGLRLFQYFGQF